MTSTTKEAQHMSHTKTLKSGSMINVPRLLSVYRMTYFYCQLPVVLLLSSSFCVAMSGL